MSFPGTRMTATELRNRALVASLPRFRQPHGRFAKPIDLGPGFSPLAPVFTGHRTGPGRKTLDTHHKKIGRSRYMPHQGAQERFRRWKRMELKKGDPA